MKTRVWTCVALALGVHVAALGAARVEGPPGGRADDPRAEIRAEREAILRDAREEIAAGKTTLGETLVRLGWLDLAEERPSAARAADRERALDAYRALLAEVRSRVSAGEPVEAAIAAVTARDGRVARYKRMHARLTDALLHGGGNCVALSTLAVALARDASPGARASFRIYANHVAPDVNGVRFGMARRCRGPGVEMPAGMLLEAYARARRTLAEEPFDLPRAEDACDDPGDVFGELQLTAEDPVPDAVTAGATARAGEATGEEAEPAERVEGAVDLGCRFRTVMEEYEEDVGVVGQDGTTLTGGLVRPTARSLDLASHATAASCFERRAALVAPGDEVELVLALGDAALAAENAARVFALAGEVDVAREYDRRLADFRRCAARPLASVLRAFEDPAADVSRVLLGAGRLLSLGEDGRRAMLLASERHRGYWELATLMTRAGSQEEALVRWAHKPVDVQVEVVEQLPCGAAMFRAQIAETKGEASRALLAACEARVRAEVAACSEEEGLGRIEGASPELLQPLVRRKMRARCGDPLRGRGGHASL